MRNRALQTRVLATAGMLVAALVLLHGVSHGERMSVRRPLREVPLALRGWQGEERPLEQRIVEAAGVDEYVNRIYTDRGGQPLGLYLGYYGSQRTGDTIHSPKNCLPGAGWEPVRSGRLAIGVPGGPVILVNEYLVEKGLDRQLVLYWYQARGRVEANEYRAKVWLVVDAITRNRTDGALVRVVTPTRDGEAKARARAMQFVQAVYPLLNKFVPD